MITNKAEFIQYIKSSLGDPFVRINVSDLQINDKIEEALQYYQTYHHDATERIIVSKQITQQNIDNGYIDTVQDTVGITEVWYDATPTGISGWHNVIINEMWEQAREANSGMTSYISTEANLAEYESLLRQKINWQFNKNSNKLRIQIDWSTVLVDSFITYEAIRNINPDENPDIYNDIWLKEFTVELVKKQWGINMSKFQNVELPGGITVDGVSMANEANERITQMKEEMLIKYSFGSQIYLG